MTTEDPYLSHSDAMAAKPLIQNESFEISLTFALKIRQDYLNPSATFIT
jgi:hypothetical protein